MNEFIVLEVSQLKTDFTDGVNRKFAVAHGVNCLTSYRESAC